MPTELKITSQLWVPLSQTPEEGTQVTGTKAVLIKKKEQQLALKAQATHLSRLWSGSFLSDSLTDKLVELVETNDVFPAMRKDMDTA